MRKLISKIVNKNEKTKYIVKCIRKLNDDKYVYSINHEGEDPFLWKIERGKLKEKGRIVFLIENGGIGYGFGAQMLNIINALAFADFFALHPVISFPNEWVHTELEPIHGSLNSWEHYFIQPFDKCLENLKDFNLLRCDLSHIKFGAKLLDYKVYNTSEKYTEKAGKIYKKYININDYIADDLKYEINSILQGKKTLGVHIRIKVFETALIGHPKAVPLEEYIKEIDKVIEQCKFEQIFVATVEEDTLAFFKNKYREKCVYFNDVLRDLEGEVQFKKCDRKHNGYKLGYEVLRDMLMLSECQGLIAGTSSVTSIARIMKKASQNNYQFIKIFNLGVNDSGIFAWENIQNFKKKRGL